MSAALKMDAATPLVRARDLSVRFVNRDATVHAVNGVDIDLAQGEVLCLLGESGSGKSVTLRALMKLLPRQAKVGGSIGFGGSPVIGASCVRRLGSSEGIAASNARV